ncbi:ATP-dependent endonuclease [Flavobacterium branchiophilum NBRC 15030 = ATCC 35035]|uniref:ATP-dependent endonuclease n=1 Tax=Flavobacterium branchiophilum TaxID=55197 RepID=A0A2H3KWU6_9FLAO|nr:AAA family ATPase [Flavobacterium branchiophilum]OXA77451.1 ATP-dependent endonuclease [Flavobacterium branchiophilum NBRC 15030 = ATCC 35035]PDS25238.1 ATP-dependent endonuclease [Flavobacterium branchiophilum]TQM39722.1 exodeoxyribonuclease-5 [Flavobacterium branchiophilum]GEM56578.1 ATP-dependent exodeoxyribonuclease [Flavobacterium branchiophilum NBRC 15030 = ATCC 35035]
MESAKFYSLLNQHFPFEPTLKQAAFLQKMAVYITNTSNNEIFVLKGFAGTGKTTLIATIVNQLAAINKKYVLLAPTGRAAKVIANYSQKPAFTIHKKIYYPKKSTGGGIAFTKQQNKHKNTLFIVDEASMISDIGQDSKMYENGSLLDDLIDYIYSGTNCKMILLGDTAQLPPVNMEVSPALDPDTLALHYDKKIDWIELDEVMRQALHSGILYNATELRSLLKDSFITEFRFKIKGFKDIIRLTDGYDIQDAINTAYSNYSIEDTAFIVRSNKRANQYNEQIRSKILFKESELATGDFLMVVKNNYYWLKDQDEAGFIANGDIIEVLEIHGFKELYQFKFARVKIRMVDYPNQKPFETVLILDTISSESPALTYEQSNLLYTEVMKDYEDEKTGYNKYKKVRENEYFNGLQVKFSYAITCHKSQGGQWNTVFIEQPYLPEGINSAYIRWLYTAITRAKDKLYLIGFKDDWFL